eukprot:692930-Amphidinium_carterae.1
MRDEGSPPGLQHFKRCSQENNFPNLILKEIISEMSMQAPMPWHFLLLNAVRPPSLTQARTIG